MSADSKAQLLTQIDDFRSEADALYATLTTLTDEDWDSSTTFKAWTIRDVMLHLHFGDRLGLLTLTDTQAYDQLRAEAEASTLSRREFTAAHFGDLNGADLAARWRDGYNVLCDSFVDADPDTRLRWAGPGMKPRMFITARQMETWAHGFEIYDYLGVDRTHSDRVRNIATLGVRTYGWTFANRKADMPGPAPYVRLTAPSGAIWEWNEPQEDNQVVGPAVDFCQVVTQVRNIADVDLRVTGGPATDWMRIAQCFAGPPEDPPAPGTRAQRG